MIAIKAMAWARFTISTHDELNGAPLRLASPGDVARELLAFART